ncbi:Arylsulfatase [Limihaloglobus sulfuriphilus]|uniref:Arylsulfatase n=1 Tax=Limihaloglobus sulfuriphilus TaxID=1851148 RepID=A0A1Q2MFR9_9BACT|nr:arylsulfatase [Limihaloglobus sulfuriphilus]AQQ71541.1 Arylsulfatase [Limihaloglobus sulfuriphilus]
MKITRRDFVRISAAGLAASAIPQAMGLSSRNTTAGKPNILLILADDMGYSDSQCYGGEIKTPNLAKLAENGLRFTQLYSTGRCWPSRACILSGYYAQQIRRDKIKDRIEMGDRPGWAKLLPEMLKPAGYKSYHSGKWHIDGTPIEAGFDRSWGRHQHGCDWDRFFDSKTWQEDGIKSPVKPGEPYYSTTAIADHTIACLKLHQQNTPDTPFFQFTAFYSPHWPLHALQEDIDAYRGEYSRGWDLIRQQRWQRMKKMGIVDCALSKREDEIAPSWNLKPDELTEYLGEGEEGHAVAWDKLSEEQKKFQAEKMEIHAAMITRMDAEIGRIIAQLKEMGEYENTLIIFVSDNGASAELYMRGDGHDKNAPKGSAATFMCLGPGWSTAANTPFRLHKYWNHEGGISSPCIVHWPRGIKDKGRLRHNPGHFIDFVPTALDAAGVELQENAPARPGMSLLPAFAKDNTVKHEYLWWAHEGNRAIRKGDWKLTAGYGTGGPEQKWQLYNIKKDRCEMNDLAAKYPEKVQQLKKLWEETVKQFENDLADSG